MKQKIALFLLASVFAFSGSYAQGGFQRRTVEERVKAIQEKFAEFKLDKSKSAEVDSIFTDFFKAQDKLREELRANSNGERPNFEQLREKMKPLIDARDTKLSKVLTDDQYKKWKNDIEPSLRSQRPGGGPGGGQGNN
jgi:hypothetical protein